MRAYLLTSKLLAVLLFSLIVHLYLLAIPICGNSDDCHEFATCTDTAPGEYECACNEGYTGDGKNCQGTLFTTCVCYAGKCRNYEIAAIFRVLWDINYAGCIKKLYTT
jgi:hypothetical protein